MEDIKLMREYVRLVECRNFTTVAKEFYLTQPTVTKRIQRFEREFGAQLVVRTTHSVDVTEAGLEVYESCKRIIAEHDRLVTELERLRRGSVGSIRLGVLYHGIAELAVPLVSRCMEVMPDMEVTFASCQVPQGYEGLRSGDYDAAIVVENHETPEFEYVPYARPELFCVVERGSSLASAETIEPADLTGMTWCYLDRVISLSMLDDLGLPPGRRVAVDNVDAISMALAEPNTFSVLDGFLAGKLGGSLCFVPFNPPLIRGSYGVACRKGDGRQGVRVLMEKASELDL